LASGTIRIEQKPKEKKKAKSVKPLRKREGSIGRESLIRKSQSPNPIPGAAARPRRIATRT
jgi:hypothetical protein